jgi:hypothetical protein
MSFRQLLVLLIWRLRPTGNEKRQYGLTRRKCNPQMPKLSSPPICAFGYRAGSSRLRKNSNSRLLTRAVQNRDCVFASAYRTATVRESAPNGLFPQPARVVPIPNETYRAAERPREHWAIATSLSHRGDSLTRRPTKSGQPTQKYPSPLLSTATIRYRE